MKLSELLLVFCGIIYFGTNSSSSSTIKSVIKANDPINSSVVAYLSSTSGNLEADPSTTTSIIDTDLSTNDLSETEVKQSTNETEGMKSETTTESDELSSHSLSSDRTDSIQSTTLGETASYFITNSSVMGELSTADPDFDEDSNKGSQAASSLDYVGMISVPIALAVGSVGNIITLVAMTTQPFSHMSWSVTLASMAFADTVVLLMTALNKDFVIDLIGFDVRSINNVSCKAFHFFRRLCKINSSWCVVLVCAERFVAICFPLKAKVFCTRENTTRAILAIWLLGVVYCGTSVIPVGMQHSVCRQTINEPQFQTRNRMYVIAGSVLLGVLPMSILIVLTPIICGMLLRYSRQTREMTSSQEETNKYKKASAMLVSVHVAYIILVLPSIIYRNVRFATRSQVFNDPSMKIVNEVSKVMEELVNHSINFFLYTAFNPLFRKRLTFLFSYSRSQSSQ